jgi:hypothetical protein
MLHRTVMAAGDRDKPASWSSHVLREFTRMLHRHSLIPLGVEQEERHPEGIDSGLKLMAGEKLVERVLVCPKVEPA